MSDYLSCHDLEYIFKNEVLVKLNKIRRLKSKRFFFGCLSVTSNFEDRIFKVKYVVSCLINFLLIVFMPRIVNHNDDVFLFLNIRNKSFNNKGFVPFKIGLFNFRYFKYPHIYSCLTKSEIGYSVIDAFNSRKKFDSCVSLLSESLTLEKENVCSLLWLSFFRRLDICLAARSTAMLKKVSTSGHFDVYTALLSKQREFKNINFFHGNQHGLYERFTFGKPSKLYFDEYTLLFSESKNFFLREISSSFYCVVNTKKNKDPNNLSELKCSAKYVLGFGFQNDNLEKDKSILSCFLSANANNYNDFFYIVYIHPQSSEKLLNSLSREFPNVLFEKTTRYSNINALITRYSTIGMDYVDVGVHSIFILDDDDICISLSENKLIHVVNSTVNAVKEADLILGCY